MISSFKFYNGTSHYSCLYKTYITHKILLFSQLPSWVRPLLRKLSAEFRYQTHGLFAFLDFLSPHIVSIISHILPLLLYPISIIYSRFLISIILGFFQLLPLKLHLHFFSLCSDTFSIKLWTIFIFLLTLQLKEFDEHKTFQLNHRIFLLQK